MAASPNLNELLLPFVMLFSSGFGLPLGVPPQPEDELLARVAPEQCLFYTAWSGMAAADSQSANQTEQLLAEPELQQLTGALLQTLKTLVGQSLGRGPQAQRIATEGPKLIQLLLTHPTALYVGDVKVGPGGPQVTAGLIVNVFGFPNQTQEALEQIQADLVGDRAAPVQLAGAKFYRLQLAPQAPPITWGVRGKYLIAGMGDGAVEGMLERVRSAPPPWLADLRKQLPVERLSAVTYLDFRKGLELVTAVAGKPAVGQSLDALGFKELTAFGSVSGLDATGYVSRTWLGLDGEPRGLLTTLAAKPLTAEDLAPIPQEALVAAACRCDVGQLCATLLQVARQIDPRSAGQWEGELAQLDRGLPFRLREDLLKSLGDAWTISTAPGEGGLVAGWIATVQLRNRQRLAEIHEQLLEQLQQAVGKNPGQPQIRRAKFADQDIFYLVMPVREFPFTPAWCLTKDRLVVALFPQAVKSYLARGAGFRSLAEQATVKPLLQAHPGPLALTYADTRQLFRTVYPLLQLGVHVALRQAQGSSLDLDPALWPSTSSIEKHLLPSVATVRRTESGVELVSHGTLPSNIGTSAPIAVALLLPAVQSARGAAQRTQGMNNLKQIALAMHNFHDVYRGFPAAYNTDKDGKPLLSWRVHLLPFLEAAPLYQQFHLDEPWDSEHNNQLIAQMPATYRAPGSKAEPGKTVYVGPRGKEFVFVEPKAPGSRTPVGTGLANIPDGTSNTIMVVEASDAQAVVWTQPEDFEPTAENPFKGLVGLRPGGFLAALCDGSVRFIAASLDARMLWALFTKAGGEATSPF